MRSRLVTKGAVWGFVIFLSAMSFTVKAFTQAGDMTLKKDFDGKFQKHRYGNVLLPSKEELEKIPKFVPQGMMEFDAAFDWRVFKILPETPQYQDDCGSCWAFAPIAQAEYFAWIYDDGAIYDLSEQQIIDCDTYGGDCDGGPMLAAYRVMRDHGSVEESDYPYEDSDVNPCRQDGKPVLTSILSYRTVTNNVNTIKEALLEGPVTTAIDLEKSNPAFFYWGSGCYAVVYDFVNDDLSARHAVLIVGWDDTQCGGQGAWIVENSSWPTWGVGGFGYIKYNVSNIGQSAFQMDYGYLAVLSPNGGEVYRPGDTVEIKWTYQTETPTGTDIELSVDGGANWDPIASVSGTDRSYLWTVPDLPTVHAKIRVTTYYELVPDGRSDESNSDFTIRGQYVYVSTTGTNIDPYATQETAALSIEDAIDVAEIGDTVLVLPGIYNENGIHMRNSIPVVSQNYDPGAAHIYGHDEFFTYREIIEISGLATSAYLRGFTIGGADKNYGVFISNCNETCNIQIVDCVFEHNRFDPGAGVHASAIDIYSNGIAEISSCTFTDNGTPNADYGGAVRIASDIFNDLSVSISDCEFTDNPNAILVRERPNLVAVTNCSFSGNDVSDLGNQYSIVDIKSPTAVVAITASEFSGNTSGWSAVVEVDDSYQITLEKTVFANNFGRGTVSAFGEDDRLDVLSCTFADNDWMIPPEGWVLGFQGNVLASLIDKNIVSYNERRWFNGVGGPNMTISDNCIIGNYNNDYPPGEGNFTLDPEFCDRPGGDYSPSALSPCAEQWNDEDPMYYRALIGALDLGCAPDCEVAFTYPESYQFYRGCPQGDWDVVFVTLDFDDADMTRDVESFEMWLDHLPMGQKYELLDSNEYGPGLSGDTDATSGNGYESSIDAYFMMGGGNDQLAVRLKGYPLANPQIYIKTPDFNRDYHVNLSDLPYLGASYNKNYGDPGYNDCCDFNGDLKVNMSDFAFFGEHYQHFYDPITGTAAEKAAKKKAISNVGVALEVSEAGGSQSGRWFVDLDLTNGGDAESICFGLQYPRGDLAFEELAPDPESPFEIIAADVVREGKNIVFVTLFKKEPVANEKTKIGTLGFRVENIGQPEQDGIQLTRVFGEVIGKDGVIKDLAELGRELEIRPDIPLVNALQGSYPNPFNPSTVVEYSIASDGHVNLSIYNVGGQLVRTLVDKDQKANRHSVQWDGRDNAGEAVASGIYFCRLVTNRYSRTIKMALVK